MLRFELVQDGEFDDPVWELFDEDTGRYIGYCYFTDKFWWFNSSGEWGIGQGMLRDITDLLDVLDNSTKQQRILGFL